LPGEYGFANGIRPRDYFAAGDISPPALRRHLTMTPNIGDSARDRYDIGDETVAVSATALKRLFSPSLPASVFPVYSS